VARHVAAARAVLDELNVERTVVLGPSWGGHRALQPARAHPEQVSSVVVVDGMGSTASGGARELGEELRRRLPDTAVARCRERDLRLGRADASDDDARQWLALLWSGYFADPATAPPLPPDMRVSLAGAVGTFASVMEEIPDGRFARRLRQLSTPVVVLVGEKLTQDASLR
jgi:pimeloyl-ACP methyl ester carboxylesterase